MNKTNAGLPDESRRKDKIMLKPTHKPKVQSLKFSWWQESIAEYFGTMVLLLFGIGCVAMVVLFGSNPPIPGEIVKGGYTNITIGWGLAVTFGIYIAGTISGAHLNPAVTIALAATRRMPWWKVPHYIVAQFAGAFSAAALTFADFHGKWIQVDPKLDHTTGIFCTFPAVPGFWPGFFDQIVGTALLLGLILAVVDKLNAQPGANMAPFIIGLIVVAIGMSFGGMNGYAINPARDLGPRLFAVLAGFSHNGLTDGVPNSPDSPVAIWTIPVIGPVIGGLLGAFAYDLLIGRALRKAHAVMDEPDEVPSGRDPSHKEQPQGGANGSE
jgi:glycerol uptake facilitator protein